MLDQAAKLIIDVAFGLVVYSLIARFLMQLMRAPFRNPIGQANVNVIRRIGIEPDCLGFSDVPTRHAPPARAVIAAAQHAVEHRDEKRPGFPWIVRRVKGANMAGWGKPAGHLRSSNKGQFNIVLRPPKMRDSRSR